MLLSHAPLFAGFKCVWL